MKNTRTALHLIAFNRFDFSLTGTDIYFPNRTPYLVADNHATIDNTCHFLSLSISFVMESFLITLPLVPSRQERGRGKVKINKDLILTTMMNLCTDITNVFLGDKKKMTDLKTKSWQILKVNSTNIQDHLRKRQKYLIDFLKSNLIRHNQGGIHG